jgi:hypothetical protein
MKLMDLPALLPKQLKRLEAIKNEKELFKDLEKNPPDLILFFQFAADDETWSESHISFLQHSLQWLTEQTFQDRLEYAFVQKCVAAIRRHPLILGPLLPQNLEISLTDVTYQVNSLLWQGASPYLRVLIREECRDKGGKKLHLKQIKPFVFDVIQEYLSTEDVKELWRKEEEEIVAVVKQAANFEIIGLQTLAETILHRYIARGNCVRYLLLSQSQRWLGLKTFAAEFINQLDAGVFLAPTPVGRLSFEFFHFKDSAMHLFEDLKGEITHLVFGETVSELPPFSEVIHQCPRLLGVSLSRSRVFSDRYGDLPKSLEELDLSKCQWLNHHTLKSMLGFVPHIHTLCLANNTQLDYKVWGELAKLKNLLDLDLGGCHQLKEEEFRIILQGCRGLKKLNINQCKQFQDKTFFDLPRFLPSLQELDLSRTTISDQALIEIATRLGSLAKLNLNRCETVTERGVKEAVRFARQLEEINLTRVNLPAYLFEELHKLNPFVKIIC